MKAGDAYTTARGDLVVGVVAGSTRRAVVSVAWRRSVHASTGVAQPPPCRIVLLTTCGQHGQPGRGQTGALRHDPERSRAVRITTPLGAASPFGRHGMSGRRRLG
jgi:hypothetical protein